MIQKNGAGIGEISRLARYIALKEGFRFVQIDSQNRFSYLWILKTGGSMGQDRGMYDEKRYI